MAKAINWPKEYYEEILNEDFDTVKIAIRPDTLYYDTNYYTLGEVVDLRVDHRVLRKAVIADEMMSFRINEIPDELLKSVKKNIVHQSDVINFLKTYYNRDFDENSLVTLISYRNLNDADAELREDPRLR